MLHEAALWTELSKHRNRRLSWRKRPAKGDSNFRGLILWNSLYLINIKDSKSIEAVNLLQLQASHSDMWVWLQASCHRKDFKDLSLSILALELYLCRGYSQTFSLKYKPNDPNKNEQLNMVVCGSSAPTMQRQYSSFYLV